MIHTMIHTFQWNFVNRMPSNKQIVTLNLSLLPGLLPPLKTSLVQIAIALLVYTIFNLFVV